MKQRVLNKLLGEVEVNRSLLLLLSVGGLYALAIALSQTFVNVYIWRQSGKFFDIGLYHLGIVIMQPLTFLIAGKWTKKIDRVVVLRLGVIFLSVFFFTVLGLGEKTSEHLLLLGGLLGIGYGFYWLAFNVLTFEITEPDTRDFFNGFLGLLTSFAGMIGPFTAGLFITKLKANIGYKAIFSASLTLFIIAVILSLFIEKREVSGSYSLKPIFLERQKNKAWRNILHAHFFQGWRDGTFAFILTVWIYVTTKSEFALGIYGLVTSGISLIVYYIATRAIAPVHRKKAIFIGGLMLYFATFIIVTKLTFTKIIMYGVIISIAYPILLVPYLSITYDVIGKSYMAGKMRVEYIVVRELFLNLGRVTSVIAFLFTIRFFNEISGIPILLLVLGIGHFFIYFCVRNIEVNQLM